MSGIVPNMGGQSGPVDNTETKKSPAPPESNLHNLHTLSQVLILYALTAWRFRTTRAYHRNKPPRPKSSSHLHLRQLVEVWRFETGIGGKK